MNTPPNAASDPRPEAPAVAPAPLSATRPFYWSLRRELWEYRSIYLAPLAMAALFLAGFLISLVRLPARVRGVMADPSHIHTLTEPYHFAAALIMGVAFIVQLFYCLDTLYSERRDRSILFWKSLPVSDLTIVLAKATIPFILIPLLAFVITAVTGFIMLVLSSAVLMASGLSPALLWTGTSIIQEALMLLYHLVTVHMLWYAPLYGWLLLISAWARRAPFLWAVLPPFVLVAFENHVVNSHHLLNLIKDRVGGGATAVITPGTMPIDPATQLTPGSFLASPGLWLGLAFAAACLFAAARLRRSRSPI